MITVGCKPTSEKNYSYLQISQFTERKDKNGSDIYENDIVNHGGYDSWEEKQTKVVYKNIRFETDDACLTCYEDWDLEVVGNIFENPELLNKD